MANQLLSPNSLIDYDGLTPPACYVDGAIDFSEVDWLFTLAPISPVPTGTRVAATGTVGAENSFGEIVFGVQSQDGTLLYTVALPFSTPVAVDFDVEIPEGETWTIGFFNIASETPIEPIAIDSFAILLTPTPDPAPSDEVSYNCDCDAEDESYEKRTLAELRQDMLIDLGYSQQLNNPPTGIVLKINRALQRAQRFLYLEHEEYRISRYYTWDMVEGVRFYDITENADACTKKLSPDRIEWAGMSDGDRWYPLAYGIPSEFYSDPQIVGRPNRYEIRQCIEVWPAPESADLKLRIKGEFGLLPFEEDTDVTTINPDAVFNWAMYTFLNAKGETGKAESYAAMANAILDQRTAASHGTARYIPGAVVVSPEPRPIFLGLED